MRLVDNDQVLVLEQHLLGERDRRFGIEFAVVPDAFARTHRAVRCERCAGAINDLAARHAVAPGGGIDGGETLDQQRQHAVPIALRQAQVARRDALHDRQRCDAIGLGLASCFHAYSHFYSHIHSHA